MKVTRFRCTVCGKLTTGRVPGTKWMKGDGTWRYPRRHKVKGKPCTGNLLEAEWIDIEVQS